MPNDEPRVGKRRVWWLPGPPEIAVRPAMAAGPLDPRSLGKAWYVHKFGRKGKELGMDGACPGGLTG